MSRLPRAARWCAAIAFVNALVWSFVTPPFHVADETGHLVYVQHLAETGDVPDEQGAEPFSPEQGQVLDALRFPQVVGNARERTLTTEADDRALDRLGARRPDPVGPGGAIESSTQPPLYYALEAGVYLASPSRALLDRLWLMRVLSCLLAAATAAFTVLFLRELFREPWAWALGGLAVAFQPVFGFTSSGLTPDSLLFAASAATLFGMARAFRRGLSPRLGAGIGVALAVGALAKLNFLALIPGVLLGLGLLVWRTSGPRRPALVGAGAAVGILAAAVLAVVALNLAVWDRSAWGGGLGGAVDAAGGAPAATREISRAEQLSYVWQLYLPRLPFMDTQFEYFPPWQTWFKGFVGVFGWLDTPFPTWSYKLALGLAAPLLALALVGLFRIRERLAAHWPALLCFATISAGVLVSVGVLGLRYREDTGFAFEQARYLFPLLPLYAAGLVMAARGAGRRLAQPAAAVLVVLLAAHGLFGQLLVIARFYG